MDVPATAAPAHLPPMHPLHTAIAVDGFPDGVSAWITTRDSGSFGLTSNEPVSDVSARWDALGTALGDLGMHRLTSARQVHGAEVVQHQTGWRGWLRLRGVDGHITNVPGTALAVTVADCTPVFIAHPTRVVAALHAGWRGTAAGILNVGLDAMAGLGCPADECQVYLGPAICGACYEVGPEVFAEMGFERPTGPAQLDVRSVLAEQAFLRGVRNLRVSTLCTQCHVDRLYSHRAGDLGRQLGIIALHSRNDVAFS